MFKPKIEERQVAPERPGKPLIQVVGAGALRIDSASLLRLPRVQAQIKADRDLQAAKGTS